MRTWLLLAIPIAFAVGVARVSDAAEPKAEICWQCESTLKEVKKAEKADKREAMAILLKEAEIKANRVVSKIDPEYGRAWIVLAKVSWYFGETTDLRERGAKVEKHGTEAEIKTARWLLANPHGDPVPRVGAGSSDTPEPGGTADEAADVGGEQPADTPVTVQINGKEAQLEPQARQRGDVTYVPARAIADAAGASVWWEESSQTVTITLGEGETEIAKETGIVVEDQLLLPLDPVAEAIGAEVEWDEAAKTVRLTTE
jgi:hypothetical protein